VFSIGIHNPPETGLPPLPEKPGRQALFAGIREMEVLYFFMEQEGSQGMNIQ
jgi:hypothetical protein